MTSRNLSTTSLERERNRAMKKIIFSAFLVLVSVVLSGCVTAGYGQLVTLEDGRPALVRVDPTTGSVLGVTPVTPEQNQYNLSLQRQRQSERRDLLRHQENQQRLELQRQRQEDDDRRRNVQSVTRALEDLSRTYRQNVQAGTNFVPTRQQVTAPRPNTNRPTTVRRVPTQYSAPKQQVIRQSAPVRQPAQQAPRLQAAPVGRGR